MRRKTAVKLLAPRQKKLLPDRPTPLPPPIAITKELVSPDEWDIIVLCILEDWKWLLTFEQLVIVARQEGPFYGFSIDSWASDRVEIELQHSVMRLKAANLLRIGKDKNTLLPPKSAT